MRKKSLVPRLIITLNIIIFLVFFLTATVLSVLLQNNYFNERKRELKKTSKIIEKIVISYINNDEKGKKELPIALNLISNAVEADVFLVDNFGYIYGVSNPEYENLKFSKMDSIEISKLKEVNWIEKKDKENHTYAEAILDGNYFMGAIVFVTPLDIITESVRSIFEIIWASVLVAVIILSITLYYVSRKTILQPLETINNAAKKLAHGDIGNRVEIIRNDEIGQLANSFNSMATAIEESEMNRREFISNISHELRSPITSIKGFITAILDGVIPKDKEDYYLRIANDEILRLTRLINDLLDLSTMQAGKMNFIFTEVDINHLIKTTVIKMQPKVLDKNIKVEVLLESGVTYVRADNDKIIQVITNLLDNAIKYCTDGGKINISSKSKGDKVIISVYNNGPSIAEEDLKYIWDRFYKADKSRTNKTSTGLGLPIVRNIILQHGEEIWIENGNNGVGVRFNFTLKKIN